MDPEAVKVGKLLEAQDKRFHIHHSPFSGMAQVLTSGEWGGKDGANFVHGVLLDLGISSPQLDGDRGFRPEFDSPLDMRFDVSRPAPSF